MLYLKVFHLVAIISWMAGIFYLPRIFVHYVEGQTAGEDVRRLAIMARKLYRFTSGMAVFSLLSGGLLWYWQAQLGYVFSGWIHVKLLGVAGLIAYHLSMRMLLKRLQRGAALPASTTLRWYNELPLAMLVVILWMVVLKPF